MARTRSLALAATVAVVLGACGDGDANSDPGGRAPGAAAGSLADAQADKATTWGAILNGSPSTTDMFPAVGAVVIRTWGGTAPARTTVCTGTLIAADMVLSAAHCRPAGALSQLPDKLPVQAGALPTAPTPPTGDAPIAVPPAAGGADGEPPPRQRRQPVAQGPLQAHVSFCLAAQVRRDTTAECTAVAAFIVDPAYRLPDPWEEGLGAAHDIALLVLAAPLAGISPATLLADVDAGTLQPGAPVAIAGYGRTGPDADGAPGRKRTGMSVLGEVGATEMVVGPSPTVTRKTFGDSGGPTFVQTPAGPRLAGITSRICSLAGEVGGTVDSRVDAAALWLAATLQATCTSGLRPSCRSP